ncbi:hypothetical protein A6J80_15315 [Paracoccus yeei]|uniref:Uncharacterized protein n=1 Tax=Paracoccus yeei TaxID=147645 RepID=A0A1V0GUQ3_9RHOB|nr:hypothetical protein [Paracoccus yeei]ARC37552.1 hypothetical protein A6J80_15315 [Paracoccus yeei]
MNHPIRSPWYADHPRHEEIANDHMLGPLPVQDACRNDGRDGTRMLSVVLLAILFVAAGLGLWLVVRSVDQSALLDFLAPTAAQARDLGWLALTEGS